MILPLHQWLIRSIPSYQSSHVSQPFLLTMLILYQISYLKLQPIPNHSIIIYSNYITIIIHTNNDQSNLINRSWEVKPTICTRFKRNQFIFYQKHLRYMRLLRLSHRSLRDESRWETNLQIWNLSSLISYIILLHILIVQLFLYHHNILRVNDHHPHPQWLKNELKELQPDSINNNYLD